MGSTGRGSRPVPGTGFRNGKFNRLWREWIENRDFIQSRLKTEIYNLALGVEKGDEVEAQSDPQIQKALEAVLKPAV